MEGGYALLTDKNKPLKKTFEKVDKLYNGKDDMSNSKDDIASLENSMTKMWGRYDEQHCQTMVDRLFEIAASKMSSDADKDILKGLR